MSVLTISEPVTLACGECASGYYTETDTDRAACPLCGNEVVPSFDVAPYMDSDERMVWVDDTTAGNPRILSYFTEEVEEEEGVDY